jgi:predicted RNA binding protein YcfA (HicA-like mRNA interferase family)
VSLGVGDIKILNRELPELFARTEVPSEWEEDFTFVHVERPDIVDSEQGASGLLDSIDGDSFGASALPMSPAVTVPYGGPGAPLPFDIRSPFPPPDALAFYLPFHYFFPTWWGIYLIHEGVDYMAMRLSTLSGGQLSLGETKQITRVFLYHHEAYHHMVECFATRLELTHRRPLYKDGFERLFRRLLGTGKCVEEALATAQAFRSTLKAFKPWPAKKALIAGALRQWIDGMPPDYRAALEMLSDPRFNAAQDDFAEANHREALGGRPIKASTWANFPQAFRGIGNVKSRVKYMIPRTSPLLERTSLRLLRPSELKQMLRGAGCEYVRDGGAHEIWRNRFGKRFPIPRHPGDLAKGTLAKIIKQAGVDMSVSQFVAAL